MRGRLTGIVAVSLIACGGDESDPRVDVLLDEVAALQQDNADLRAAQAVLEARLEELEEEALTAADLPDVTALDARVEDLEDGLDALDGELMTLSDLTTAQGAATTAQGDQIAAQGTLITSQADLITLLDGDLVNLGDELEALDDRVAALEADAVDPQDLADAVARLDALEGGAMLTADLAAWLTSQGYAVTSYVDAAVGEALARLEVLEDQTVPALQDGLDALDATVAGMALTDDTTWTVDPMGGGDFTSIEDALAAASAVRILPGATLTLQLAPGTHALTGLLTVDHPDGNRLQILGDTSDPSLVAIVAATDTSALYVPPGCALDRIDGVTIAELTPGGATYGIRARAGYVGVGNAVVIEGFDSGLSASVGGMVVVAAEDAGQHLTIVGARYAGVLSVNGSFIYAPDVEVSGVAPGARGLFAARGATIWANDASVIGDAASPGLDGAYAEVGSTMYVPGLFVSGMTTGSVTTGGSFTNLTYASFDVSGRGLGAFDGSTVRMLDASIVSGSAAFRTETGGLVHATGTAGTAETETEASSLMTGTAVVH